MSQHENRPSHPFTPRASSWLTRASTLLPLRAKDAFIHSKLARNINAARLYFKALVGSRANAASLLCSAYGYSSSTFVDHRIISKLRGGGFPLEEEFWRPLVANFPRYRSLLKEQSVLTRSIILKEPGAHGEKGVLLMCFEYNWARLAMATRGQDFQWIDDNFDLILSTSWSPTDYLTLSLLLSKTKGPLFVQPCNRWETEKLARFHERIIPVNSLPCDWINPSFYAPVPLAGRDIDILMVANWGEFKRHWDFFNVLRQLPANWRIVLVGQREGGRDAGFIAKLANRIGVPQSLEIHQSIPISEVSALQQKARVSLIFTRREGCCVAAVESIFAGCAVGMRADAHIGSLDYLNPSTGGSLRPGHLAEDILSLHAAASPETSSEWGRSHISCHHSLARLAEVLKAHAASRNLPWTRELRPVHWRPHPCHINEQDQSELSELHQECHRRYPDLFPVDLMDVSKQ